MPPKTARKRRHATPFAIPEPLPGAGRIKALCRLCLSPFGDFATFAESRRAGDLCPDCRKRKAAGGDLLDDNWRQV
jgi:hypothetical protein